MKETIVKYITLAGKYWKIISVVLGIIGGIAKAQSMYNKYVITQYQSKEADMAFKNRVISYIEADTLIKATLPAILSSQQEQAKKLNAIDKTMVSLLKQSKTLPELLNSYYELQLNEKRRQDPKIIYEPLNHK